MCKIWNLSQKLLFIGTIGIDFLRLTIILHFTMEELERPRKMAKLHGSSQQRKSQDDGVVNPVVSGTLATNRDSASHVEQNGNPEVGSNLNRDEENFSHADAASPTPFQAAESVQKLSKNQLRKLRRRKAWEAQRDSRKIKRKEKLIAKRARQRAERKEANRDPELAAELQKKTAERRTPSTLLPLTFVVDCGFDELMHEKERTSLASQLTRSYSDNSKAPYRAHLVISSFDKLLKERFETVLCKTHENWKGVHFMQEDYVHAAELAKERMEMQQTGTGNDMAGVFSNKVDAKPEDREIVYLTSDSSETLTELKPYSTYIIGGLVDKNRHKGICYKRAMERGIKTAKLPIGDYIQMASRSVLATNHVVEIMLRWLELGDWGEAFMRVIPKRKGAMIKGHEDDGNGEKKDLE